MDDSGEIVNKGFNYLMELGFEQSFSCVLTLLMLSIVIHTHFKYGDIALTKITTRPYKAAYCFLLVALFESMFIILMSNIVYAGDVQHMVLAWVKNKEFKAAIIGFETLKFAFLIAFITFQTFELQILYCFVSFQHMLRVEDLPIRKAEYHCLEKQFTNGFNIKLTLVFLIWLGMQIASISDDNIYQVMFLQLLISLFGIFAASNYYIVNGFTLLRFMRKYHRHEYHIHRNQLLSLVIVTYCSMFALFWFVAMGFYLCFCQSHAFETGIHEAWYGSEIAGHDQSRGMCQFFINGFNGILEGERSKRQLSAMYFGMTIVELTPILAFFSLNMPHDCFVCLGKDPERTYSSFQYTKTELIQRKIFIKSNRRQSTFSTRKDKSMIPTGVWHQRKLHNVPKLNSSESMQPSSFNYSVLSTRENQCSPRDLDHTLRVSSNQMMVDEEFMRAGLTTDEDILMRYAGSYVRSSTSFAGHTSHRSTNSLLVSSEAATFEQLIERRRNSEHHSTEITS